MIKGIRKLWKIYTLLGTSPTYSEEENDKIQLMNKVYLFCGVGFGMSFSLRIIYGLGIERAYGPLIAFITFCCLPYLSYLKKHRIGWHLAGIIMLSALTFAATQRPILYVNYLLYGTITFLLIYLNSENKKTQYIYIFFIALNVITFAVLSNQKVEGSTQFPLTISLIILSIALIANYFIISLSFEARHRRELELAKAISLKNAALEANKDATVIINHKNEITSYNQKYLELWEIEARDLVGWDSQKSLQEGLKRLNNPDVALEAIHNILANVNISTSSLLYLKNHKIIELHSQPQNINNTVVGRVFNFRDVTKEHTMIEQLQKSENSLRSFFEHSPLGVCILEDYLAPLKNVNERFCKMLGYSNDKIVDLQINDICCPSFIDRHIQEYRASIASGKDNFTLLNKYITKSGETFWGNLNVSLLKDENGEIIGEIAMVEDVNDKINHEKKIKELVVEMKLLNEQLEHKVKSRTVDLRQSNNELRRSNQDLEQFAYIASHDLQEPLRMIGNFVQLLERQYKNKIDEEGKEYIHYIVDGVSRMSKLIQNLLKYSRVGRKESALRSVNLERILEAKLFGLKQKIVASNATLIINKLPQKVFCEPDQIGMVFFNLITNALKFNNGNPEIEIGFEDKGTELVFYVKDNGIGIDQRYENKVFEIFKRLHRREEYEGTGIGLALCKKIIARHGGKIWFESQINEGTIFYFIINKSIQNEKYVPIDTNLVG